MEQHILQMLNVMVTNERILKEKGKFQIQFVYEEAARKWQLFEPDNHSKGKLIEWNLHDIKKDDNKVVRRPEYSLEKLMPTEKLLEYQTHHINCNVCVSKECTLSRDDPVYMEWFYLKSKEVSKETPPRKRKTASKGSSKTARKKLKLEGKPYNTYSGKEVPAVKAAENVPCKCRNKCFGNFIETDRCASHRAFWKMNSYDQRRQFIANHVTQNSKKRLTVHETDTKKSRRDNTWNYELTKEVDGNDVRVPVCRIVFMKTLQVSEKFIRNAVRKSVLGIVQEDKRGQGASANKTSDESLKRIHEHIDSFPKVESHYCRKGSTKLYIEDTSNFTQLTISKMHDLYQEKCRVQGVPSKEIVGISKYRNILKEKNIVIHKPKKDQCVKCLAYKEKIPSETSLNEREDHEIHMKNKAKSHKVKEERKEMGKADNNHLVFTFDLEAILYTPCCKVSTLFYARKLNTYNLTMFNMANKEGHCYLWDETVGNKGSNEVGSGLYKLLKENPKVKKVTLISDACGGQTRNKKIAALCLFLVRHTQIEEIDHIFMVSGHSHMEVDSMHATIEDKSKSLQIYKPEHWAQICAIARKNPYLVDIMSNEDIFDLEKLYRDMKIVNITEAVGGERAWWTTTANNRGRVISWLRYEQKNPNVIKFRTDYDETGKFVFKL